VSILMFLFQLERST